MHVLERTVLGTLQSQLMNAERCELFCREYTNHINELQRERVAGSEATKSDLERTEREIAKLVQALKNGVDPILIRDEINGLQAKKLTLQEALEHKPKTPVFVHPKMAQHYHREVQQLIGSFNEAEHRDEAAELIRRLIAKIVLTHNEDKSALAIDLYGNLAGILRMAAHQKSGMNINLESCATPEIRKLSRLG